MPQLRVKVQCEFCIEWKNHKNHKNLCLTICFAHTEAQVTQTNTHAQTEAAFCPTGN